MAGGCLFNDAVVPKQGLLVGVFLSWMFYEKESKKTASCISFMDVFREREKEIQPPVVFLSL